MTRLCFAALLFLFAGVGASPAQDMHNDMQHGMQNGVHNGMRPDMPQETPQGMPQGLPNDTRELVRLPPMMQAHMLGNMRSHLATLNEILGDIADGNYDHAAKIAEARLGMSSLSLHGSAELAPHFPQPMQDIGTSMHHAASRLVIVLQDASVSPTADAMRKINGALHEVTSACEACHAGYRLR